MSAMAACACRPGVLVVFMMILLAACGQVDAIAEGNTPTIEASAACFITGNYTVQLFFTETVNGTTFYNYLSQNMSNTQELAIIRSR
jgi:hypothetical protein